MEQLTVRRRRPLARRRANTLRPFAVDIRSRNPCLFTLFLLEGWNVLFITVYYFRFYLFTIQSANLGIIHDFHNFFPEFLSIADTESFQYIASPKLRIRELPFTVSSPGSCLFLWSSFLIISWLYSNFLYRTHVKYNNQIKISYLCNKITAKWLFLSVYLKRHCCWLPYTISIFLSHFFFAGG